MKTEEEIKGLAEKQYPLTDGTTEADRDTLLTFQNILIKGYKQALSDIQEEKQKGVDLPELVKLFTDESNGITDSEDQELCNILGTFDCRSFLNALLFDKSIYIVSVHKTLRAYEYLSQRYKLPIEYLQPVQESGTDQMLVWKEALSDGKLADFDITADELTKHFSSKYRIQKI